jgi:transcriptional antiterminator
MKRQAITVRIDPLTVSILNSLSELTKQSKTRIIEDMINLKLIKKLIDKIDQHYGLQMFGGEEKVRQALIDWMNGIDYFNSPPADLDSLAEEAIESSDLTYLATNEAQGGEND